MIAPACRRCLGSHPAWSLSQCVSRGHHSSGGAATLIAVRHLPPPAQPGSPRTTKHQRFHRHSDRFVSLAPPGFCPYGIPQRRCQRGSVQLRFPEVLARQSSLLIASLRCSLDFCKPLLVRLTSVSRRIAQLAPNPLGPLADLRGTWVGRGFNQVWRPFHGTQDRFLELNETRENLQFEEIPGDIPNRGLLQEDINLHGLTYLQQIFDVNVKGPDGKDAGIHIEPGIWVSVPTTTNPQDAPTVARLANIPHGTSLVAQGNALPVINQAPPFTPASITPFTIAAPHSPIQFPETNLGIPSQFRTEPTDIPNVTQAMVNNPNVVLAQGVAGKNIISTTTLKISTTNAIPPPSTGGGTANIAFLQGAAGGPNAVAAQMDAAFWIETIKAPDGSTKLQLQYSQTVLLNFNGLSWPHVSVATLEKA